MKVVILCGGLGTRLREETEFRPKPMVEVGGRPILWHIMKIYAHYGFHEFVLCLGYRGNTIKEYFLNYAAMNNDFTIALDTSQADRGSQRALRGAVSRHAGRHRPRHDDRRPHQAHPASRLRNDLHGHLRRRRGGHRLGGTAQVPSRSREARHRNHGPAHLPFRNPRGRADGHTSSAFQEKPQVNEWISAGFFVFEPGVFDYFQGDECVMEREPLARLAADGQLMAYRHHGFFFAMDTFPRV